MIIEASRARGTVFALLVALSPVSPAAAWTEIPARGYATEVGFAYVDAIRGSSLIEITCVGGTPSNGFMTASVVAGHASLNGWQPSRAPEENEDGLWLDGRSATSNPPSDRRFVTSDARHRFVGMTSSVIGPSGQSWEHLVAVATIGGALGNCMATSKGTPIPFIKAGRAGWEDLGGPENPLWIRQGNIEAGSGRVVEVPLLGGRLIGQTWHDQGTILAAMSRGTRLRRIEICTPARGPVCTFTDLTATALTASLAAGLSQDATSGQHAAPLLLYFDLPPEAGPKPCLVGFQSSCLVEPID